MTAPARLIVLSLAVSMAFASSALAVKKPPAKATPAKTDAAATDTPAPAAPAAAAPAPAAPVTSSPPGEAPTMGNGQKEKFDVGELAPTFALRAVNNDVIGENLVSVDRYFGSDAKQPKKAVLISFFATWCEPCKKEMPFLAALYETYKDKGVMILSVSIDREAEQIDVIKSLATNANAKYPVLSDRFNIVAKRYMVSKLPLVYVMSPDGKVAFSRVGYTEDTPKALHDEIRRLIGETNAPIPDTIARYIAGGQTVADASKSGQGGDAVATATVNKTTTVSSSATTTDAGTGDATETKAQKAGGYDQAGKGGSKIAQGAASGFRGRAATSAASRGSGHLGSRGPRAGRRR